MKIIKEVIDSKLGFAMVLTLGIVSIVTNIIILTSD